MRGRVRASFFQFAIEQPSLTASSRAIKVSQTSDRAPVQLPRRIPTLAPSPRTPCKSRPGTLVRACHKFAPSMIMQVAMTPSSCDANMGARAEAKQSGTVRRRLREGERERTETSFALRIRVHRPGIRFSPRCGIRVHGRLERPLFLSLCWSSTRS